MARGNLFRQATYWFVAICATYLLLAYFMTSDFWSSRLLDSALEPRTYMTQTPDGAEGEPINVGLVGSEHDVVSAMQSAGWSPADKQSPVFADENNPASRPGFEQDSLPSGVLLLNRKPEDMAFERMSDAGRKERHRLRLWHSFTTGDGRRPTWYGTATLDEHSDLGGSESHGIAADLDAARDYLIASLNAAGRLQSTKVEPGVGFIAASRNAQGDPYFTDGKIVIAVLVEAK